MKVEVRVGCTLEGSLKVARAAYSEVTRGSASIDGAKEKILS